MGRSRWRSPLSAWRRAGVGADRGGRAEGWPRGRRTVSELRVRLPPLPLPPPCAWASRSGWAPCPPQGAWALAALPRGPGPVGLLCPWACWWGPGHPLSPECCPYDSSGSW